MGNLSGRFCSEMPLSSLLPNRFPSIIKVCSTKIAGSFDNSKSVCQPTCNNPCLRFAQTRFVHEMRAPFPVHTTFTGKRHSMRSVCKRGHKNNRLGQNTCHVFIPGPYNAFFCKRGQSTQDNTSDPCKKRMTHVQDLGHPHLYACAAVGMG